MSNVEDEELSLEFLDELIDGPQTVEAARAKRRTRGGDREYTAIAEPLCEAIRFTDTKHICAPGRCGSTAYIMVKGEPRCLMHAFRDACNIIRQYETGENNGGN